MNTTPLSKRLILAWSLATFWLVLCAVQVRADEHWFERFKAEASDRELYTFLYAMPKGGDLHNHMSGSGLPEWWYELALEQKAHGYEFYTKVQINNCKPYGHNEFGPEPYLLMFHNILASTYETLPECEKTEYKLLSELNQREIEGWKKSVVLNHDHEGREEFFSAHWQRFDELLNSPYLMMEILYRNMEAFGREGLIYLEAMMGAQGYTEPDGTPIPADQAVALYKERLSQKDARDTGITVRLQEEILRFSPNAEQQLIEAYEFVSEHRDLYLAVNLVGREDNDKGYPMRFKETLRELRRTYSNVRLSLHAGELDEPNRHIRDTLTLGADRIGHGIQLINDEGLLRELRHGPYLIEINLISNLLLEYVDDYTEHPFPEYLRIGVPVALSTDDRGMWHSNITDEFFVAVKGYNLSWNELKQLSRNSLAYAFVEDEVKQDLIGTFDTRIAEFEARFKRRGLTSIKHVEPTSHDFTCNHYQLCDWE